MFLERVELFGFKSFADRTEIRFSPGITAVVGPNGCGKSNIFDAIRWALGEQNIRNLRGKSLQDVIFNGTREVKPMGMAEVTLHLDNHDQRIASEFSSVTIRRRAYRSGESEFFINKTPCRLKDIREMFLDTGLGSVAYSVIEREMVDEVLSDRDEARRYLLDEAAGITRYKQRRRETLRKLEAVERDLTRVEDILEVEEREVRSLAYQTGKARRYERLSREIARIEVGLARRRWEALTRAEGQDRAGLEEERRRAERLRSEIHGLEAKQSERRAELADLDAKLGEASSELASSEQELEGCRRQALLVEERRKAETRRIEELGETLERARAASEKAGKDLEPLLPELESLEADLEGRKRVAADARRELVVAERRLRAAREVLGRLQQLHLEHVKRRSAADHRSQDLRKQLDERRRMLDEATRRRAGLSAHLEEVGARAAALGQRRDGLEAQLGEAVNKVRAAEEELERLQEHLRSIEDRRGAVRSDLAALRARLEVLETQQERREGFKEASARLLQHGEEVGRVLGAVSDLVKIEPEWMKRLAAAIDEMADWIVVSDMEAAWRAASWLAERNLGGVTLLPLNDLQARGPESEWLPAGALTPRSGKAPGLIEYLRSMIRPVGSRGEALSVGPVPGAKYVTPEGDVVSAARWVRPAAAGAARDLVWSRLDEIASHREKVHSLESQLQDLDGEAQSLRSQIADLRSDLEAAGAQRAELESELSNLGKALGEAEAEERLTKEEIERVGLECQRLENEIKAAEGSLGEAAQAAEAAGREESEAERRFQEADADVQKAAAARDETARTVSSLEMEVVRAEARLEELRQRIREARRRIDEGREAASRAERQIEEARHTLEDLAEEAERLRSREVELAEAFAEKKSKVDALSAERTRLEDDLARIEEALREKRRELSGAEEALRQQEVVFARLEAEREALRERVLSQYHVDLASPREEDDSQGIDVPLPEDWSDEEAERKVAELLEKRSRLGPVNPLAVEQYEAKREHVRFIRSQRDDLLKSKETLLQVIDRINREASRLFHETFSKVEENFRETFQTLFPGGEAHLRLEGDDPLEARIQIVARPRGKRLESIHLLSSGERALTAIALLFGLYLVKPSPFCVLDEVDAPLDDANIDRFLSLLRRFSEKTQFIVITHNKRTMEVADALYGVTMQEPGISRIVSVRLEGGGIVTEDSAEPVPGLEAN